MPQTIQPTAHTHREPNPDPGVIMAAGVIAITILLVGAHQISKQLWPQQEVETIAASDIAAERSLLFVTLEDGSNTLVDADTGETIYTLQDDDGFIVTVMRGMEFRRNRGKDAPPENDGTVFRLVQQTNSQLTIFDTSTGVSVNLTAFGADNRARFAKILTLD